MNTHNAYRLPGGGFCDFSRQIPSVRVVGAIGVFGVLSTSWEKTGSASMRPMSVVDVPSRLFFALSYSSI
jgi:hypothetical protein